MMMCSNVHGKSGIVSQHGGCWCYTTIRNKEWAITEYSTNSLVTSGWVGNGGPVCTHPSRVISVNENSVVKPSEQLRNIGTNLWRHFDSISLLFWWSWLCKKNVSGMMKKILLMSQITANETMRRTWVITDPFINSPVVNISYLAQSLLNHSNHNETLQVCLQLQWLTRWGRVTHIWVSKLTIIGSDNGLLPGWRQAIFWINARILLIGPLWTNFSEIHIAILTFSFKKMRLKVSSAKGQPFRLGLNVLISVLIILKNWGK